MADAKVIPFDDDRSRAGAAARPSRRRSAGSGRRKGEPAVIREVQPLPGRARPQDDVQVTREQQPPQESEQSQGRSGHQSSSSAPGGGVVGDLERRVAGGLSFLRRRLTGDYEVDDLRAGASTPAWRRGRPVRVPRRPLRLEPLRPALRAAARRVRR